MYQLPLTTDQVTQFHGEITSHVAMRNVATVPLLVPVIFEISITDDSEFWKLRAKGYSEVDDDASFLLPNDYNASTNNVIWCRIG